MTTAARPPYQRLEERGHATLLQANGPQAMVTLAIPALIALAPVVFPKRSVRAGAALALWAFSLLGGFTIGFFYVPSAVIMTVAGGIAPDRSKAGAG